MQHGTGREAALELVENVEATLNRWGGRPYGDMVKALRTAATILENTPDLDERGVYGKDYPSSLPRVTPEERAEAIRIAGELL